MTDRLCGQRARARAGSDVPELGDPTRSVTRWPSSAQEHKIGAWKVYTHAGGPGGSSTTTTRTRRRSDKRSSSTCVPLGAEDHRRAQGLRCRRRRTGVRRHPSTSARPRRQPRHPASSSTTRATSPSAERRARTTDATRDAASNRLITALRDGRHRARAATSTPSSAPRGARDAATRRRPPTCSASCSWPFGPDNVLWGTDSIWYGSPQDQIQAFRAFEITPEFQEHFGYPALTPAVKEKILGKTSAKIYKSSRGAEEVRLHPGGARAGADRSSRPAPAPTARRTRTRSLRSSAPAGGR